VSISLLISLIAYALLDRSRITRTLFLGLPSLPVPGASAFK